MANAENIFANVQANAGDNKRSFQWYQKQVQNLRRAGQMRSTNQIMQSGQANFVNRINPGEMYLFQYDPKHKDKLPYYDTLPLVLPFRRISGGMFGRKSSGFLGINLHYLPYMLRYKVLGELSKYATDDRMDERTKIKFSYQTLSSVALLKPAQACVKHYLADHVQSRFLKINISDWVTASQLPIEQFVGSNKQSIWRDTRKRY
jgi:hypothetical protein